MEKLFQFLIELDQLKSIERRSLISDGSRRENSAEHSWHLALGLLALKQELNPAIDFYKAIKMALVHDICEIGAGDVSIFDPDRHLKQQQERDYLEQLTQHGNGFALEIQLLWEEYEAQQSAESHWVKVLDRLLPFMLNIQTEGRVWREQGIKKSQVLKINEGTRQTAPQVFDWMQQKIRLAVEQGWLIDDGN